MKHEDGILVKYRILSQVLNNSSLSLGYWACQVLVRLDNYCYMVVYINWVGNCAYVFIWWYVVIWSVLNNDWPRTVCSSAVWLFVHSEFSNVIHLFTVFSLLFGRLLVCLFKTMLCNYSVSLFLSLWIFGTVVVFLLLL